MEEYLQAERGEQSEADTSILQEVSDNLVPPSVETPDRKLAPSKLESKEMMKMIEAAHRKKFLPTIQSIPLYDKYQAYCRSTIAFAMFFFFILFLCIGARELSSRAVVSLEDGVKKISIHIEKLETLNFAPWPIDTDTCTIRIMNTCNNRQECGYPRILGYGINHGAFGLSDTRAKVVNGDTLEVTLLPLIFWPSLPETWWNRVMCDVQIIASKDMEVEVFSEKVAVVAENVELKRLDLKGLDRSGSAIWFQGKNVRVTGSMTLKGSQSNVFLDGITMPTSASATLEILGGSIDLVTSSHPKMRISSVNEAVCLVGKFDTTPVVNATMADNVTVTSYRAAMKCDLASCEMPSWSVNVSGAYGSVGVHAVQYQEQDTAVFQGRAFSEGTYVGVDHSPIVNDVYNYAIISFQGLGIMQGGLEVVWSLQRIWWFIEGQIWPFGPFSAFTVIPQLTKYPATVSFCPAHGSRANLDLTPPLRKMMSTAVKDGAPGQWTLRNLGSYRERMQPLDVVAGKNVFYAPKDSLVPDCDYCADVFFWKSSAYVGSFSRTPASNGNCLGFGTPNACLTFSCYKKSAHIFSLVENGQATCYSNEAVEALLSNPVKFAEGSPYCWASGDVSCYTEAPHTGPSTSSRFANGRAITIFTLSLIIGAIAGVYVVLVVYFLFIRSSRIRVITGYLMRNKKTFDMITRVIKMSQNFAILNNPKPSGDAEPLLGPEGEPLLAPELSLDFFALDKIIRLPPLWYRILPRTWKEKVEMKFELTNVRVSDFASHRWIAKCSDIASLAVDDNGSPSLQGFDKNQVSNLCDCRIVYLDRSDRNEFYEWHDVLPRKAVGGDRKSAGETTTSQQFLAFQRSVREVQFVMQRLQIDVWLWFILERVTARMRLHLAPPKYPDKAPAYWEVGREIFLETIHTQLGEVQTVAAHLTFVLAPCLIFYFFLANMFYMIVKDKGTSIFGVDSDAAITQDAILLPSIIILLFLNLASMVMYYFRWRDWGIPHESTTKGGKQQVFPEGESELDSVAAFDWDDYYRRGSKSYRIRMYEQQLMKFVWAVSYMVSILFCVLVSVWVLLGMFLNPNRVAPYATAIVGLFGHVLSMFRRMKSFFDSAKGRLEQLIVDFHHQMQVQALDQIKILEGARNLGVQLDGDVRDLARKAPDAMEELGEQVGGRLKEAQDVQAQLEELFNKARRTVADVKEHEILALLSKHGISMQDIIIHVTMSSVLLCLIFLFLFLGMSAFNQGVADNWQTVINSIMTGGAAIISSFASKTDGGQALENLLMRIIEEYKKGEGADLSFSLNEELSSVLERAGHYNHDEDELR
ncbi:hypothetical protein GUITHDRAFT_147625 [Guillardia theta CCMP2712]|uniref:Uncharacterized protein n=4 Tax=Guillardia theta TaxID=55529 RepID=L1IC77_GUITC|nr:hypothetical protein GUITHDRAFT_147625 [Guillardia theta CCMP2712]EKX33841.1 hypothetical protein GUITHDRAFT_147625 [Guillardia theta CCMP2712]|eukprot:XP_005820821.1 hypothetical protein GUITHDRAFT_147625 [Guillardia theta CCMP2712]